MTSFYANELSTASAGKRRRRQIDLVKMIHDLAAPGAGSMQLDGISFAPSQSPAILAVGTAMIFLSSLLSHAMGVAVNVAFGMETPTPPRWLK